MSFLYVVIQLTIKIKIAIMPFMYGMKGTALMRSYERSVIGPKACVGMITLVEAVEGAVNSIFISFGISCAYKSK